jgi:hypothetical protein
MHLSLRARAAVILNANAGEERPWCAARALPSLHHNNASVSHIACKQVHRTIIALARARFPHARHCKCIHMQYKNNKNIKQHAT